MEGLLSRDPRHTHCRKGGRDRQLESPLQDEPLGLNSAPYWWRRLFLLSLKLQASWSANCGRWPSFTCVCVCLWGALDFFLKRQTITQQKCKCISNFIANLLSITLSSWAFLLQCMEALPPGASATLSWQTQTACRMLRWNANYKVALLNISQVRIASEVTLTYFRSGSERASFFLSQSPPLAACIVLAPRHTWQRSSVTHSFLTTSVYSAILPNVEILDDAEAGQSSQSKLSK